MERLSAPERTREELRALMNGELGTAAGRSDLVRLALRLIVEEALEGEVSDVLGRDRCVRGEGEKAGYRNGYRPGKVKTAEGAVDYSAPQARDTAEPFVSKVRAALSGRRGSSNGWLLNFTPAACRPAISKTRLPTRRATGFCRGRR